MGEENVKSSPSSLPPSPFLPLTFPPLQFVALMHDGQQQVLVPVAGGQHDAVVKKLVNRVQQVILTHSRVGYLVEPLESRRRRRGVVRGGCGRDEGWEGWVWEG